VGTDSTAVRMQHCTIVRLRCDTVYVLHSFIPIEETGTVSTVTGMVVEMGTRSVPVKNPTGMTNSKQSLGLEAMVGDQGTTGNKVELGGYWRQGLLGLG